MSCYKTLLTAGFLVLVAIFLQYELSETKGILTVSLSATLLISPRIGLKGSQVDDRMLVDQYQQTGEVQFVQQLIGRYESPIASIYYRYNATDLSLEDVNHELLILLSEKLMKLEVRGSMKSWLCTTTRNWLIDRQRHQSTHQNYCTYQRHHSAFSEAAKDDALDQQMLVKEAFSILRSEEATCVRMHYLEGRTYEEIAQTLDWSFRKVTGHMYRAIKRLREKMDMQSLADCLQTA